MSGLADPQVDSEQFLGWTEAETAPVVGSHWPWVSGVWKSYVLFL